ncbi:MAG: hypothetical protein E6G13_08225 [Actinobacteria bacterium]|nr:MAG: hypothetical protein E6G13_08225 [Actinomycetota bacterium]
MTQIAPQCRVAGRFVVNGRRGVNKVKFTGRLDGRPLPTGTYRVSAQAWGGATILQVILVVFDSAPSPTELEHARHANVCASSSSSSSVRALASNAMLASGGAAGATGSGASKGAVSEIVRSQTSSATSRSSAGHPSAAPFSASRISGNSTRPLVLATLAIAVLLLGVSALPQQAIPDPRVTDVLARHRLEVALAGVGALAAALIALVLA